MTHDRATDEHAAVANVTEGLLEPLAPLGPLEDLPGNEAVLIGLRDVARGLPSPEAALVQCMTRRFAEHGVRLPRLPEDAELVLYRRLAEQLRPEDDVYGRYNALLEDLVSFVCALDRRARLSPRR